MPIGQSAARSLRYKAYSSAAITPGPARDYTVDPANSGGQILRHLPGPLFNLQKANFQSREKRVSRQVYSARHGGRRVPFEISGEFSPGTYKDLMAGVCRGAWSASISKDQTVFTSLTISGGGVTGTVAASTWAAQGFRVGDVVQLANMSVAGNNGVYTQLIALSGTVATFYPPLTDNTADTTFSVATVGKKLFPPLSSPTQYLFLFETYDDVQDLSDLGEECRMGGMQVQMPAEGIVGITFSVLGRDVTRLATGTSPFFASPTAATTTDLLTTNTGQLLLSGTAQSVITGINLSVTPGANGKSVAFADTMPEIYGGKIVPNGTITGEFVDNTIPAYFDAETEFEIALMMRTGTTSNSDFVSMFMPRVKLMGFEKSEQEDGSVSWSSNFVCLEKATTTGYDASAITFQDSQA